MLVMVLEGIPVQGLSKTAGDRAEHSSDFDVAIMTFSVDIRPSTLNVISIGSLNDAVIIFVISSSYPSCSVDNNSSSVKRIPILRTIDKSTVLIKCMPKWRVSNEGAVAK